MKKVKVSKILHRAADECLWRGVGPRIVKRWPFELEEFSCCAAATSECAGELPLDSEVCKFLRSLGCPTGSERAYPARIPEGPIRQAYRYSWLKFAAMYAEELEAKGEL